MRYHIEKIEYNFNLSHIFTIEVIKQIVSGLIIFAAPHIGSSVETATLSPTVDHLRATQLITDFLRRYHYRKFELDDNFSEIIFDNFLTTLDPSKSYFLATDIARFDKYRLSLDDALKTRLQEYRRAQAAKVEAGSENVKNRI